VATDVIMVMAENMPDTVQQYSHTGSLYVRLVAVIVVGIHG
jgi:hypothetical protein